MFFAQAMHEISKNRLSVSYSTVKIAKAAPVFIASPPSCVCCMRHDDE